MRLYFIGFYINEIRQYILGVGFGFDLASLSIIWRFIHVVSVTSLFLVVAEQEVVCRLSAPVCIPMYLWMVTVSSFDSYK